MTSHVTTQRQDYNIWQQDFAHRTQTTLPTTRDSRQYFETNKYTGDKATPTRRSSVTRVVGMKCEHHLSGNIQHVLGKSSNLYSFQLIFSYLHTKIKTDEVKAALQGITFTMFFLFFLQFIYIFWFRTRFQYKIIFVLLNITTTIANNQADNAYPSRVPGFIPVLPQY